MKEQEEEGETEPGETGSAKREAQPIGAALRADLEIGAELEEEAVVVVAVGALLVAGAEVEVEAGIQLVTEPSGVGVVVG